MNTNESWKPSSPAMSEPPWRKITTVRSSSFNLSPWLFHWVLSWPMLDEDILINLYSTTPAGGSVAARAV